MLLEEFEDLCMMSQRSLNLISGGNHSDTIILSFNGEINQTVKADEQIYEGGYLTNLNINIIVYL